ncbi:MAG: ferredoxin family protein [Candidatus Euphemobacter frigidus]|nr:ferredoxin family protein [Candidatus Euphemobacter frigidus]MDP8274846.1 ferredoxin family protein [Candidatus Euphemobacter frigidus]
MPKIFIDQDRCKGCALCVEVCPKDIISIGERINKYGAYPAYSARPDECTGCGLCVTICPDVAITIYK